MSWISVKDKLPNEDERVLVVLTDKPYNNESMVCAGERTNLICCPSGFQLDGDDLEDMCSDKRQITHWQPLPEAPIMDLQDTIKESDIESSVSTLATKEPNL